MSVKTRAERQKIAAERKRVLAAGLKGPHIFVFETPNGPTIDHQGLTWAEVATLARWLARIADAEVAKAAPKEVIAKPTAEQIAAIAGLQVPMEETKHLRWRANERD